MKLLVRQKDILKILTKQKKDLGGSTSKDGYTRMNLSFIHLAEEIQLTHILFPKNIKNSY